MGRYVVRLALFCSLLAFGAACSPSNDATNNGSVQPAAAQESYPAPRWPAYFKRPTSVDDLMPAARTLVRNPTGFQGDGLGILRGGDAVLIVPTADTDPMVLEAIQKALAERQITASVKFDYEFLGETREQVLGRQDQTRTGRRIEDAGIYQASDWITGQFPNPDVPKKWLKDRRPDLYAELFPSESAPAQAPTRDAVGEGIKGFLTQNPQVRGVFWGRGGSSYLRRSLYPMHGKLLGSFVTDNVWDLQSQMTTYPGDVWKLAEEQTIEPIVYTDRVEIKDPEGIDLWADLTPDMAERWSQGVYQRGHLYMFPNQATGRFGFSTVNYPALQQQWLPREPITRINGTLAGTQGHGGFFPRWEITFEDGFIADVKGGGAQGEALKEFLRYPGISDLTFPYHTEPGFWYLFEIAFGSHPKGFRHPQVLQETGNTSSERMRSGVIHWGLGIRIVHDPDAPVDSKTWNDFAKKHNTPIDHGWHTHTNFTTYKVRLRNADKWVTLVDKGRMVSLDHPEVRALASRYGDPDYILAEDWIPEVPGINVPGDYLRDYAPNPGAYSLKVVERATSGSYEHYFPAPGTQPITPVAPGTSQ